MIIRRSIFVAIMFMILFFGGSIFSDALAVKNAAPQEWEIWFLRSEFQRTVNDGIILENDYQKSSSAIMMKMIKSTPNAFFRSQFFVYVDRNSSAGQLIMFCFYDKPKDEIKILGADKISTGNPKIKGHFMTPTGIFKNTTENFSFRALGTKNEKGWRGFGARGSRVWDFGWQETIDRKNNKTLIRLLMHATDPNFGEPRLGRVDSKGCVRISARMNKFLDHFGILDKEYENKKSLKKVAHLLKGDRRPTPLAGEYVLVGDSKSAL